MSGPPESARCTECGKLLSSKRSLARHLSDVHGIKPKYACPHCGIEAESSRLLREHITEFHGQARRHRCATCGRMFARRRHLTQHVANVHQGRRDFECTVCDQTFTQRGHLHEHVRRRHPDELAAAGGVVRSLTRRRSEMDGGAKGNSGTSEPSDSEDSGAQSAHFVHGWASEPVLPDSVPMARSTLSAQGWASQPGLPASVPMALARVGHVNIPSVGQWRSHGPAPPGFTASLGGQPAIPPPPPMSASRLVPPVASLGRRGPLLGHDAQRVVDVAQGPQAWASTPAAAAQPHQPYGGGGGGLARAGTAAAATPRPGASSLSVPAPRPGAPRPSGATSGRLAPSSPPLHYLPHPAQPRPQPARQWSAAPPSVGTAHSGLSPHSVPPLNGSHLYRPPDDPVRPYRPPEDAVPQPAAAAAPPARRSLERPGQRQADTRVSGLADHDDDDGDETDGRGALSAGSGSIRLRAGGGRTGRFSLRSVPRPVEPTNRVMLDSRASVSGSATLNMGRWLRGGAFASRQATLHRTAAGPPVDPGQGVTAHPYLSGHSHPAGPAPAAPPAPAPAPAPLVGQVQLHHGQGTAGGWRFAHHGPLDSHAGGYASAPSLGPASLGGHRPHHPGRTHLLAAGNPHHHPPQYHHNQRVGGFPPNYIRPVQPETSLPYPRRSEPPPPPPAASYALPPGATPYPQQPGPPLYAALGGPPTSAAGHLMPPGSLPPAAPRGASGASDDVAPVAPPRWRIGPTVPYVNTGLPVAMASSSAGGSATVTADVSNPTATAPPGLASSACGSPPDQGPAGSMSHTRTTGDAGAPAAGSESGKPSTGERVSSRSDDDKAFSRTSRSGGSNEALLSTKHAGQHVSLGSSLSREAPPDAERKPQQL